MSDHEPAVGIVENDKSLAKHRKKRPNKKIKRYGIAGSSSESQQKDIADHPPTLRHMNPPAIPKGTFNYNFLLRVNNIFLSSRLVGCFE